MAARGGVTVADVNLKLIWDVISQIKVGKDGYAYVVDRQGRLVAHPDISLVLRGTDMSRLRPGRGRAERTARRQRPRRSMPRNRAGVPVLSAHADDPGAELAGVRRGADRGGAAAGDRRRPARAGPAGARPADRRRAPARCWRGAWWCRSAPCRQAPSASAAASSAIACRSRPATSWSRSPTNSTAPPRRWRSPTRRWSRGLKTAPRELRRIARAADGDGRDPARHLPVADRRAAGAGRRGQRRPCASAAPATPSIILRDGDRAR